ncbi:hypothetical protein [Fodinibius salsisoli]|uniref:Lipase (Class 3) n=1 Tax=Fodinibius salsisoli TaxID=2820877 RepID=A0ABT3PQN3_9BACT|nr:hypothetical protein [Fodinibius salsisoli]MCW9708141.1 hypothetical protein [Fodinibius salsisoli]
MDQQVIIYIHGISPDENLATIAKVIDGEDLREIQDPQRKMELSHRKEYEALQSGVKRYLRKENKQEEWDKAEHCFTEWGWEYQESDAQNLGASHRLKDAQHYLGQRVIKAITDSYWFTLLPQKAIRKLALYGLADAFYYISSDGRKSIRARIYHLIGNRLGNLLSDPDSTITITIIGHSAGSVVAFDLVNYLFTEDKLSMTELLEEANALEKNISELRKLREQHEMPFTKGDAALEDTLSFVKSLITLKSIKEDNRLTLRRLITMGSPIAMMALRSDKRIRDLAYGNRIPLDSLGLTANGKNSEAPLWVNMWNKYDPISFPVEPMVEESPNVKDYHLRTAWNPLNSHTNYWHSKNVHRLLARLW